MADGVDGASAAIKLGRNLDVDCAAGAAVARSAGGATSVAEAAGVTSVVPAVVKAFDSLGVSVVDLGTPVIDTSGLLSPRMSDARCLGVSAASGAGVPADSASLNAALVGDVSSLGDATEGVASDFLALCASRCARFETRAGAEGPALSAPERPADELDVFLEPASAEATAQLVQTAAPTPNATASPPIRPT